MRDIQIKEIKGVRYRCEMMNVLDAHETLLGICHTLGEPLIKAISQGSDNPDGDAINLISAGLSAAVKNLKGRAGRELLESVFNGVWVTGEESGFELKVDSREFNEHFRGKLITMYEVWAWAVQVNYQDFFDAARSLGADKAKGVGSQVLSALRTQSSPSGPSPSTSETGPH